jgi:hypothetical protein
MNHTALHRNRWRLAAWGSAAALILLPLVAMRFTTEVNWGPRDFAFAIALVLFVGIAYEAAVRMSAHRAYRAAAGLALAATFVVWWANAAVGIIGSEDNPVNLLFDAVPLLGIVGGLLVRFRAHGMARVMVAVAGAQVAVAAFAFAGGFGFTGPFTVFFTAMWLTSAWLFAKAARPPAGG